MFDRFSCIAGQEIKSPSEEGQGQKRKKVTKYGKPSLDDVKIKLRNKNILKTS